MALGCKRGCADRRTDQESAGQLVPVLRGLRACLVIAVKAWLSTAQIQNGWVFRRVVKGGKVLTTPLTATFRATSPPPVSKKSSRANGLGSFLAENDPRRSRLEVSIFLDKVATADGGDDVEGTQNADQAIAIEDDRFNRSGGSLLCVPVQPLDTVGLAGRGAWIRTGLPGNLPSRPRCDPGATCSPFRDRRQPNTYRVR